MNDETFGPIPCTAIPEFAVVQDHHTHDSPLALSERAAAVAEVHAEIDRRTAQFRAKTGVGCPEGCGVCCLSPNVETTVEDLLPLAEVIVQRGEAESIFDRLMLRVGDRRCVFYEAEPGDPMRGRCTVYAQRPSICRLFGFAGRRDADGRPEFIACRIHTQSMPETVAAAVRAVRAGDVPLPIFSDLAGRIAAAVPGANRLQPINDAMRDAIQWAALTARLTSIALGEGCDGDDDRDDDGGRPTTPRVPPRRAA